MVKKDIQTFLTTPNDDNIEKLCENKNIIWIDHREYDEDIIEMFSRLLDTEDSINFETNNAQGFQIFICSKNQKVEIKYPWEWTDRDTTIQAVAEFIAPKYEIHLLAGSLWNDTLGFCILKKQDWKELKEEFGSEKVDFYFPKVEKDSKMFELTMSELWKILDEREKKEKQYL